MTRWFPLALVFSMLVVACEPGKKSEAELNGIRNIAEVSSFVEEFPDSEHFISYYSGTKGDPTWNSKAGIHGRYIIHLQFGIDFDSSRVNPKRVSPPTFHLDEITQIERSHGKFRTSSQNRIRFGEDEWEKLRDSGGDLSVLGIEVIADKPLEYFSEALHSS